MTGTEQSLIDDVLIKSDAITEYGNLSKTTTTITRSFNYRTQAGFLEGGDKGKAMQKYEVKFNGANTPNEMIETGFAILMNRFDIYGAYHQYPRTFFVGPSSFNANGILNTNTTGGPDAYKPYVRDIDRFIWVENVEGGGSRIYCGQLFHDDLSKLGTVSGSIVTFTYSASKASPTASQDKLRIIKDVFTIDGKKFQLDILETHHFPAEDTFKFYYLHIINSATYWSANRNGIWTKGAKDKIGELAKASEDIDKRFLATLLIGHMGYITPTAIDDQRNHSVPTGTITPERIATILKEIVLAVQTNANSKFSTPMESIQSNNIKSLEWDRDESDFYNEDESTLIEKMGSYELSSDELPLESESPSASTDSE